VVVVGKSPVAPDPTDGLIECFNRPGLLRGPRCLGRLWLKPPAARDFYKGLSRRRGLSELNRANPTRPQRLALGAASHLEKYPSLCERISVKSVLDWLQTWPYRISWRKEIPPRLELVDK